MEYSLGLIIVLAFLGLVIHALIKLRKLKESGKQFSLGFWIKDNWIDALLSVLSIIALLFMFEEVVEKTAEIIGVKFTGAVAFFIGYFNASIIRHAVKFVEGKFSKK